MPMWETGRAMRIFSGIRPPVGFHLANCIGGIRNEEPGGRRPALESVLAEGARKPRALAAPTVALAREQMGVGPRR